MERLRQLEQSQFHIGSHTDGDARRSAHFLDLAGLPAYFLPGGAAMVQSTGRIMTQDQIASSTRKDTSSSTG